MTMKSNQVEIFLLWTNVLSFFFVHDQLFSETKT